MAIIYRWPLFTGSLTLLWFSRGRSLSGHMSAGDCYWQVAAKTALTVFSFCFACCHGDVGAWDAPVPPDQGSCPEEDGWDGGMLQDPTGSHAATGNQKERCDLNTFGLYSPIGREQPVHTCQLSLFNRKCCYFDTWKRGGKEWFYHFPLFLQTSACSDV